MYQHTLQSLGVVLALGGLGLSSTALADDFPCPPNRGAVTIDGNIIVNRACTLKGTYVKGNVLVYSGGRLTAIGARIDGNIQAKEALTVSVNNTEVNGDIQLENLRGTTPSSVTGSLVNGSIQLKSNRQSVTVVDNEVNGDIQLEGQRSATLGKITDNDVNGNIQLTSNYLPLSVERNVVDGDMQAFSNRSNPLFISRNTIDGNLQCKGNVPAPTGGQNVVAGSKEDQCRRL